MAIEVAPAHEAGVSSEAVAAFYAEHWNRPIALALPQFHDWQFVRAPESDGKNHSMVALSDDEIVGVMGLNPRAFLLQGEKVSAAELTTWVVSPAARGLGVGRGIMNALQERYDLMVGLGISDAAMPIYTTSGFRHLRRIPRFSRVHDLGRVREHARVERLGERLVSAWSRDALGIADQQFEAQPGPASELAPQGAEAARDANLFVRDADALRWRYDEHPTFDYQAHAVRDPALPGTGIGVVVRTDRAPVEGGTLDMLHVIDMFGDPAHASAAVAFVDDLARREGVAFADVFMGHTGLAAHFLAAGWFSGMDDGMLKLPHLFYPVELREPATTSYVIWARKNRATAYDMGRYLITKGDLDLDRPTLAYYDAHGIEAK